MPTVRSQCLLFVLHIRTENLSSDFVRTGYALLPASFVSKYVGACQDLRKSGVVILETADNFPSLENVEHIEMIEILLDEVSYNDDVEVYLYVSSCNEEYLQRFLHNSHMFHFVKKSRQTNIRLATADDHNQRAIERFLSFGVDKIHYKHPDGGTLLHFACEKANETIFDSLLNLGAHIDTPNDKGDTVLHLAASSNRQGIWVNKILALGADINAQNHEGSAPLHVASLCETTGTVETLCKNGANVNIRKINGFTPLHTASQGGIVSKVEMLLHYGANVNATLEPHLDRSNQGGSTPLHLALLRKHSDIIGILLKRGANVNAPRSDRTVPLALAVQTGNPEIVRLILNHHPNLEDKNNKKVFLGIIKKHRESLSRMVLQMIEYGFTVDVTNVRDSSLLIGAIRNNYYAIVKKLVSLGANVNCITSYDGLRVMPLHVAARYARQDTLELLINKGADVNGVNPLHKIMQPPIYHAIETANLVAVKALLAKKAAIKNDPLFICTAAEHDCPELIKILLENGVCVNSVSSELRGRTPLMTTPYCNRLITFGSTPLMIAAFCGNLNTFKILLKFDARIDAVDEVGESVLDTILLKRRSKVLALFLEFCFSDTSSILSLIKSCDLTNFLEISLDFNNLDVCLKVLVHYMLKIKAVKQNEIDIDECPIPMLFNFESFKSDCEEEVIKMKTRNVGNSCVSFYELLTRNKRKVACYFRNETIAQTLNSTDLKCEFPIFGEILVWQSHKGFHRFELMEKGRESLDKLSNLFSSLPLDLKDHIFSYLDNQNLLILTYILSGKKRQMKV